MSNYQDRKDRIARLEQQVATSRKIVVGILQLLENAGVTIDDAENLLNIAKSSLRNVKMSAANPESIDVPGSKLLHREKYRAERRLANG